MNVDKVGAVVPVEHDWLPNLVGHEPLGRLWDILADLENNSYLDKYTNAYVDR